MKYNKKGKFGTTHSWSMRMKSLVESFVITARRIWATASREAEWCCTEVVMYSTDGNLMHHTSRLLPVWAVGWLYSCFPMHWMLLVLQLAEQSEGFYLRPCLHEDTQWSKRHKSGKQKVSGALPQTSRDKVHFQRPRRPFSNSNLHLLTHSSCS